MLINRAAYIGVEAIETGFEANAEGFPCYSVWYNNETKAFEHQGEIDEGRTKLSNNLHAMQAGGHNDVLIIKIHPGPLKEGQVFNKKSDVVGTMYVRVNPIGANHAGGMLPENVEFNTLSMVQKLPELLEQRLNPKFEALDERLRAVEQAEHEYEEEDQGFIGQVNKALENPQIALLVNGFLGKIFQQPVTMPGQISGPKKNEFMNEELKNGVSDTGSTIEQRPVDMERVNNALGILNQYMFLDTDLEKLAEIAQTKLVIFNMMLTEMRGM